MNNRYTYNQHVYTSYGAIGRIINIVEDSKGIRYLVQFPRCQVSYWFYQEDLQNV